MSDDALTPEITASAWLNTPAPLSLAALRGKVVLVHAFQMLCPGCVAHALPQAAAVHRSFGGHDVAVIGLHSVFEHHAVMGIDALKAFVHEYQIDYPVAVDQPGSDGPIPLTMRAFGLRGTPSLLLFDRGGHLRLHEFGRVHDLVLGIHLGELLSQPAPTHPIGTATMNAKAMPGCDDQDCAAPRGNAAP